jgi:hypothetical protein
VRVTRTVLCVANDGNDISLQLWKIYKTLRDEDARSEGLLRVIDESGEDYLFPEENFVSIDLPKQAQKPFDRAVREQRRAAHPRSISTTRASRQAGRSPKRSSA